MNLSYRKVADSEIEPLHEIVRDCGVDMLNRFGLAHWCPPYPIETMRQHAAEHNVHAVYADSELVGTFTTGTQGWKYNDRLWLDRRHRALYLGKLAIRPTRQGQGIGTWCMRQVEQQANALGCKAIRFDAIAAHESLVRFYVKLGYTPRGDLRVTDWMSRNWDVVVFEKIL